MKLTTFIPTCFAALIATTSVHAVNLYLQDDFESGDGTPAILAAGLTYSGLAGTDGNVFYTPNGNPGSAASHGGWNSANFDSTSYFTFTLATTQTYQVTNLSFDIAGVNDLGSEGTVIPTNFSVRSSLDSFAADLAAGSLSTAYATQSVALDTLLTDSNPLEFRIYAWGADEPGDQVVVDNLTVVPEPRTWLLLAAGLVLAAASRRFRRA